MLSANPKALIIAIALGIFGTLILSTLYILAQNYTEISKVAVVGLVEPVAATILGLIIFKEALMPNGIIAMILIFTSVIIVNMDFSKLTFSKKSKDKLIS